MSYYDEENASDFDFDENDMIESSDLHQFKNSIKAPSMTCQVGQPNSKYNPKPSNYLAANIQNIELEDNNILDDYDLNELQISDDEKRSQDSIDLKSVISGISAKESTRQKFTERVVSQKSNYEEVRRGNKGMVEVKEDLPEDQLYPLRPYYPEEINENLFTHTFNITLEQCLFEFIELSKYRQK